MDTKSNTYFPDRPQFSGFMKPCRLEGEIQALEVHGEIPKDINGTFYRVIPDPQLPPFIENDPVRVSLSGVPRDWRTLTNGISGSTEMEISAPLK